MANPMASDFALEALNRIADADPHKEPYEFQRAVLDLGRFVVGVAHVLDDFDERLDELAVRLTKLETER